MPNNNMVPAEDLLNPGAHDAPLLALTNKNPKDMNPEELDKFIDTVRANRATPQKMKKSASSKKKGIDISYLLG